jgi:Ca2+-binding RTX toxin-like protein
MGVKVNKSIRGTKGNDTKTNKNKKGYTNFNLGKGNDQYIVLYPTKTMTKIVDKGGKDMLVVENTKANGITFLFDYSLNSKKLKAHNGLFLIQAGKENKFYSSMKEFLSNGNNYKKTIFEGVIDISGYFKNMDKAAKSGLKKGMGKGYIETITSYDLNGVKCEYDIKGYLSKAIPKVKVFLKKNKINSVQEIIENSNEKMLKKLLALYTGTKMNTKITGTVFDDNIIYGKSGNDTIDGGFGDDELHGGRGNDILSGGYGEDELYGGSGNDILISSTADWDILNGGEGNDTYRINIDNTNFEDCRVEIIDKSGNDKLEILDRNSKNLHIIFDMKKGNNNIISNSLYILNNDAYTDFIDGYDYEGINIKGKKITTIETIKASDGKYLGAKQLNELKSAIASWLLNQNEYDSVLDVINDLTYNGEVQRTSLLAAFNNNTNWQNP